MFLKIVAHLFAFLKNSSYLCRAAYRTAADINRKRLAIPYL